LPRRRPRVRAAAARRRWRIWARRPMAAWSRSWRASSAPMPAMARPTPPCTKAPSPKASAWNRRWRW